MALNQIEKSAHINDMMCIFQVRPVYNYIGRVAVERDLALLPASIVFGKGRQSH